MLEASPVGGMMGCLTLLSTDLFWPPVKCVVGVDGSSLLERLGERKRMAKEKWREISQYR